VFAATFAFSNGWVHRGRLSLRTWRSRITQNKAGLVGYDRQHNFVLELRVVVRDQLSVDVGDFEGKALVRVLNGGVGCEILGLAQSFGSCLRGTICNQLVARCVRTT
jgi:hypothetical protein